MVSFQDCRIRRLPDHGDLGPGGEGPVLHAGYVDVSGGVGHAVSVDTSQIGVHRDLGGLLRILRVYAYCDVTARDKVLEPAPVYPDGLVVLHPNLREICHEASPSVSNETF